jgi:hypothetical protein
MTRARSRGGGGETRETPAPAAGRRRALTDAVDRLVGAAECLGAVPVDEGDVRALAVLVGAQARVVEALAKLDSAADRRRTGKVQRELLRARLATMPGMQRDAATGMVVYMPREDLTTLSNEELNARLARLTGAIREDLTRDALSLGDELEAVALVGLRVLMERARAGDIDAGAALGTVVEAARSAVVLPALERS